MWVFKYLKSAIFHLVLSWISKKENAVKNMVWRGGVIRNSLLRGGSLIKGLEIFWKKGCLSKKGVKKKQRKGGGVVTLKETMPYFWYTTDSQVLKRYKLFQKALKCVEKNNKKQKQQKKTTQEKERKQTKKKNA